MVAPKLTLKSQNQTVNESDTITLLCVATGDPNPNITWTKGSTVLQQTSISNYTISSAAKDDSGTYTCTAQVTVPGLSVQPDNYQVTLTVRHKPVITSLTGNQTVNDGTDVLFFCQADAVPTPTAYNWFKNGVPIPSGSSADFVNSGQQLTVRSVKNDSAGRYSCSGTNTMGTGEEKSTFLIVQCKEEKNNLTFSTQRQNKRCGVGAESRRLAKVAGNVNRK
ncbi:limbic system-associated membrane protein-like [Porites lutea]|uniref:limbic system-associated membrane protein-like n=1 Tax=Porites lutea TaxID=51062 RepID=UPI003CC635FF